MKDGCKIFEKQENILHKLDFLSKILYNHYNYFKYSKINIREENVMLDLFLSMSMLKRFKSFKNNFKKISIYTVVILAILAITVIFDFFICNYFLSGEETKIDEDTKIQIEETEEVVLSYEDQIIEAASFYKSNYDNLSYLLKESFELEFDELELKIKRTSDEETHVLAQYKSYDDVEFIFNENQLEKLEENENEEEEGELSVVLECIVTCILLDCFILGMGSVLFILLLL